MKILCLLSSSFSNPHATTTKRTLPYLQELAKRGHQITIQENTASSNSHPGEVKYLISRLSFGVKSAIVYQRKYDLILSIKAENLPLGYFLSRKLRIPLVADLDDLEKISGLDVSSTITNTFIKHASKVFVASRGLYEHYSRLSGELIYLPNSTNLTYFNPDYYDDRRSGKNPTFLWVSDKIDWFTGCKLIFSSLRHLRRGRVIIIGGGPKPLFRELSKRLGIEQQVIIRDWVPDEELPKLYSQCDFGLIPFSDNKWTRCKCPSRLFEFMAMELPYFCTVGEPAYMASELGCGVVTKPQIDDFNEKVESALSNYDELKRGAKEAREYLLRKQNLTVLGEKLENELLGVVKRASNS